VAWKVGWSHRGSQVNGIFENTSMPGIEIVVIHLIPLSSKSYLGRKEDEQMLNDIVSNMHTSSRYEVGMCSISRVRKIRPSDVISNVGEGSSHKVIVTRGLYIQG